MALKHTLDQSIFGTPIDNAYTVIVAVNVRRQKIFRRPEEEGDEPVLVSNHEVEFLTDTFASQEAKEQGAAKVAYHGYRAPFEYGTGKDPLTYCYDWLKANVGMFNNALDV